MAKYGEGTNYAKAQDPSSSNILDAGTFSGKVRVMEDTATISASSNLNSTDYIVVGGKLPTGSQVVKIIIGHPGTTALGTQGNLKVGDQGDDDRYNTAVNFSAGATVVVCPSVSTGMNYTVTGVTDNYIRLTGENAGTRVSTNTVKVTIFYVVE
jgi:hypothetical protein